MMEYSKSVLANMGLEKSDDKDVVSPYHATREIFRQGRTSNVKDEASGRSSETSYEYDPKKQNMRVSKYAEVEDAEEEDEKPPKVKNIATTAKNEQKLKNASVSSLYFKSRDKDEQVDPHPYQKNLSNTKDPDEVEKYESKKEMKKKYPNPRGREMKRSYTADEITVAQLLKGHPMAQEILDELNKGRKNESGEEFQDGFEDTIGGEGGHAAVARPGSIKHEGGFKGKASDDPGVDAKRASIEDGDLEKSEDDDEDDEDTEKSKERGTLTDNEPEQFEEGIEEDDTIPAEKSIDDSTVDFLVKTMGYDKAEEFLKAVIGGRFRDPGEVGKLNTEDPKKPGNVAGGGPLRGQANPLTNRKVNTAALEALRNRFGTGAASKSEEPELEKSEGGQNEEYEKEEKSMSNNWSMDFSKSVLVNMGLEKGSPSVSKKIGRQKVTQISYGTKPETRVQDEQAKTDTRYRHNIKEGTVTKRTRVKGEKDWKEGKPYTPSSDEGNKKEKKEASEGGFDLYKSLDAILEKKTLS